MHERVIVLLLLFCGSLMLPGLVANLLAGGWFRALLFAGGAVTFGLWALLYSAFAVSGRISEEEDKWDR